MKRAFILFWIFVLGFSLSFAQKSGKPLRVEIEANHFSDQYYIVPIADNGVMLFSKSDQYTKDKDIWIFTKYNTQFKEEWTKKYPIENGYDYKEFYYNDDMLYVFFNDNYQGETKIEIVKINLKDEDIKDVSTSFKPKSNLSYYKVLHDNIFVAGSTMPTTMESCGQMCLTYTCLPILFGLTTYKIKPVVVNVDLSSKKKKILSPVLKGNSYVISVNANQDANTMNVVLKCDNNSNAFNKSEGFTMVYEYDDKGELNSSLKLKSKSSNDLLDGKIMQVDEKEKIFIGTYSKLNGKKKMGSGYADGMCFSKIVDNQQDFIKYYDFTDFDNFYASVSARFKKKIDRKKKRGKDVSVGFLLLVHDEIIVRNDEYIMIGEAYYPEYHTESYMDANGNWHTRQVFDGYRYTHAIVAAFDKDGERLWDNTFEIMNVLSFNLKERVKVLRNSEDDEIVLVYSYGGQLNSKVIEGSKVVERKQTTKLETKNEKDKVLSNYDSDMEYWYDNYFITWGYQRIKEKGKGLLNKKRQVFYFTKIAYN